MKLIIEIDSLDPGDELDCPVMGDRVVIASDNRVMVCGSVNGWKRNGQTSKPMRATIREARKDQ